MTTDDRKRDLIEQAAKAIHDNYSETPWDDADYTDRVWAEGTARKILSVFEEAHAPTDDERAPGFAERERQAARAWEFFATGDRGMSHDFRAGYHQGMIDGFRRPVSPEPSAEDDFAPGECTGAGDCDAPVHIHGCYRPHRADECDAPDEYGHLPSEPQGELTDAQYPSDGEIYDARYRERLGDLYGADDEALAHTPTSTERTSEPQGEPSDAVLVAPFPWLLRVRERFINAGGSRHAFDGAINAYANDRIRDALRATAGVQGAGNSAQNSGTSLRDHVRALTGVTDEVLDELGGFQGEPTATQAPRCGGGRTNCRNDQWPPMHTMACPVSKARAAAETTKSENGSER